MSEGPAVTMLRLGPTLDAACGEALLADLRKARNTAVVIEAGEVARVSTLALQVLLSGWMTWRSDGHDFHIASASPALVDAAALLGLPADFLAPRDTAA
jgi:anti-anti-sigma regulatory factor